MSRIPVDHGAVFVCSTWPVEPYSNLSKNGVVLFVAVQRSVQLGSRRNIPAKMIDAATQGKDFTLDKLPPPETWQATATEPSFLSAEIGAHAGIFDAGGELIAVNRALQEDDANVLDSKVFKQLFDGLDVTRVDEIAGTQRRLQQEIWRAFLMLMIAALLLEAFLSLPRLL